MNNNQYLKGVAVAVALYASSAQACYMHVNFSSAGLFGGAHPGTMQLTLAVRSAIDNNLLPSLPTDANERRKALSTLQSEVAADVESLTADADASPLSVLLTQSGVWLRLNDPAEGAIYHSSRPKADEPTVLLPDVAYAALINGELSIADLKTNGLLRIYGEDQPDTLSAFEDIVEKITITRAQAGRSNPEVVRVAISSN